MILLLPKYIELTEFLQRFIFNTINTFFHFLSGRDSLNSHEVRSDFQIKVDDSRGRGTHLELISPVPFPYGRDGIGSPNPQTDVKRISSLEAPQITGNSKTHSLLGNSRPPFSKSLSLTCPEYDQTAEPVEVPIARLSITSIAPLPKVDVNAAFTAPNQGMVRQKRLEGFTFFTNSESNSSAESYYGEKGQLSDIDRPKNACVVRESSTTIRESFTFDSNDNAEGGSILRIETAIGCPNTASSYKSRVQKKLVFKSESNNAATDSFKVLRKKRTRFKKSGKNIQS